MAGPITWQTIRGPDLDGAQLGLVYAGKSFNAGFDKLSQVIKDQEKVGFDNWDAQKANNTAAFMEQLRQYQTPEALAAARASGALDTGKFQAQIDRAATGAAVDARPAVLQQRGVADIQYQNTMQDQKEHPVVQEIIAAAAKGDTTKVDALMAANPGLRNMGELGKARETGRLALVNEFRNVEADKQKAEKHESDQMSAVAARVLQEAQALNQTSEAEARKASGKDTAQRENAIKALIANSPLDKGTMDTTEGKHQFTTGLKALGLGDAQTKDVYYNFAQRFASGVPTGEKDDKGNPILVKLPVSVALDAVAQSTENPLAMVVPGWSRRGDDASNLIEDRFKTDKELLTQIRAVEQAQGLRLTPLLPPAVANGIPAVTPRIQMLDAALDKARQRAMTPAQLAEAQKKSPESTLVGGVSTPPGSAPTPVAPPKGAQDFGVNTSTGAVQAPVHPVEIPKDAQNVTTRVAVEAKPGMFDVNGKGVVTATVTAVEDGDTTYLKNKADGSSITCRLKGIDAPETAHPKTNKAGQAFGEESKALLQKMIANQEVSVTVTDAQDKYGRKICQISLQGRNINRDMIEAGAAWINQTYNKDPVDNAAFEKAKALKKGLFGQPNPVEPWNFRRNTPTVTN